MRLKQVIAIAVLLFIAFLVVFPPLASGGVNIALSSSSAVPVEHLYITIAEISAHRADTREPSGWFRVTNKTVQIDLGVVNLTQTIALNSLSLGQYDTIRLKLTNGTATFNNTSRKVQLTSTVFTIPVSFFVGFASQARVVLNVSSDLRMAPETASLGLSFAAAPTRTA